MSVTISSYLLYDILDELVFFLRSKFVNSGFAIFAVKYPRDIRVTTISLFRHTSSMIIWII